MKKDTILKEVFEYFQTNYETQLLNVKRRDREFTKVRHFCYVFLQEFSSLSDRQIGEVFNQDHSNVFTCSNKMRGWITSNKALKADYEAIKSILELKKRKVITLWELCECWIRRIDKLSEMEIIDAVFTKRTMETRMLHILDWAKRFGIKC